MTALGPTRIGVISPRPAASIAPVSDVSSQGCATAVGIGARRSHRAKSCSYFPLPGFMPGSPCCRQVERGPCRVSAHSRELSSHGDEEYHAPETTCERRNTSSEG